MNAITARWKVRSLNPDEQAEFHADARGFSFLGEIRAANRRTSRLAWFSCVCFAAMGTLGMVSYVQLLPYVQRHVENHWLPVDQSTGWIGESVGATDAPKTFNGQVAQYWIRTYIETRENYVWQTDGEHFRRVQLMSSDDEGARYIVWHKDALSPVQKLGRHGYVETDNFHAAPYKGATNDTTTLEYTVQFRRRETDGQVVGPWENRTADIQFQWHPELVLTDDARDINPGGMVVLFYHSDRN